MQLWGLVLRRNSRLSDCRTRTMRLRGCLLGQSSRRLAVSGGSADRCDSELFPCSLTPNREGPPSLIQETAVKVNAGRDGEVRSHYMHYHRHVRKPILQPRLRGIRQVCLSRHPVEGASRFIVFSPIQLGRCRRVMLEAGSWECQ